MDTSVSGFISQLDQGLARPSRFRAEFSLPPGPSATTPGVTDMGALIESGIESISNSDFIGSLMSAFNLGSMQGNISGGNNEKVNIFCHTATLPLRSLKTFDHRTHTGPTYTAPYSGSYEAITVSFYADSKLNTRNFFDTWQQAATNIRSDTNNYWVEFVADFKIHVLDQEGEIGYSVKIFDAFPVNISSVDLSYSSVNTFLNVAVTFAFRRWEVETESSDSSSGLFNAFSTDTFFGDFIDNALDSVDDFVNNFTEPFTNIFEDVTFAIDDAISEINTQITDVVGGITDITYEITEGVTDNLGITDWNIDSGLESWEMVNYSSTHTDSVDPSLPEWEMTNYSASQT